VTVPRRLNPKARIATAIAVVLLLASPVLALRNCMVSVQKGSHPIASGHAVDDRLVELKNGTIMFLQNQPLAVKVSEWLQLESNAKAAFEVSDGNFAAGSASLTPQGRTHVIQVAQILTADPRLNAQVTVLIGNSQENSARQLEQSRASRIRNELLAQRVAASNVTTTIQPAAALAAYHVINQPGEQSHVFILVSR
jgi:outer membrane protein OmpA-like peptidoglycan-associated protein